MCRHGGLAERSLILLRSCCIWFGCRDRCDEALHELCDLLVARIVDIRLAAILRSHRDPVIGKVAAIVPGTRNLRRQVLLLCLDILCCVVSLFYHPASLFYFI